MMKLAILMTATIKVQVVGGNFTANERKDMYVSTLKYYTQVIGKRYPIIFLENSDYDLHEIKRDFDSLLNIEWIQLPPATGIEYNPNKGKSYNEYLMIKEGVLKSTLLKECTHFLKITGRYAMVNILSIIGEIEHRGSNKLFMGDIKDTNFYDIIGSKRYGHWGDSRFWVANVDYYKAHLIDCYKEMNDCIDGMWAEHYLLRFAKIHKTDENYIFRFRNQVLFNGITGMRTSAELATGKYRQDSIQIKVKNKVRYILRVLFPNFWF